MTGFFFLIGWISSYLPVHFPNVSHSSGFQSYTITDDSLINILVYKVLSAIRPIVSRDVHRSRIAGSKDGNVRQGSRGECQLAPREASGRVFRLGTFLLLSQDFLSGECLTRPFTEI